MSRLPAIGVYMPQWLYRSDKSDRMFADELVRDINASGRYRAFRFDLPTLRLRTLADAERYKERKGLKLVIQHDSSFYSSDKRYARNAQFLESVVPFLNPRPVHDIGHDKDATKKALRKHGIPVLDDVLVRSVEELHDALSSGQWFVVKPTDQGAGAGVRLLRSENGTLFQFSDGAWGQVEAAVKNGELSLKRPFTSNIFRYDAGYRYAPMLVEPYFNDDADGFASIRATVVGQEVVEAVKRVNKANITSNVSAGGSATSIELSEEQKKLVVDAKNAIGADYAGVDMLVSGGQSVIGEINIGPFTLFSKYTGAAAGARLASYAIAACDMRD